MWPVGEAQLLKQPHEAGGVVKSLEAVSDGQAPDGDRTRIQGRGGPSGAPATGLR